MHSQISLQDLRNHSAWSYPEAACIRRMSSFFIACNARLSKVLVFIALGASRGLSSMNIFCWLTNICWLLTAAFAGPATGFMRDSLVTCTESLSPSMSSLTCRFGGTVTNATYLNNWTVVCVAPFYAQTQSAFSTVESRGGRCFSMIGACVPICSARMHSAMK